MQSKEPQTKPTLETVQQAFEDWRAQKVSRQARVPELLWQMARTLIGHYKRTHITSALRLSTEQYRRYILQKISPPSAPRFLELPIASSLQNQMMPKTVLRNGMVLEFFSGAALTTFLEACHVTARTE